MRPFQIIFNPTSAAELSKMPKELQLEILGQFRGLPVHAQPRWRFFVSLLDGGSFVRKLPSPDGTGMFQFLLSGGESAVLAYAFRGSRRVSAPFAFSRIADAAGEPVANSGGDPELGGSPVYFLGVKPERP